MSRFALRWSLPALLFAFLAPQIQAEDPVPKEQLREKLVGTWKMISFKANDVENDLPTRLTVLKHITPTHMTWMRINPETSEVVTMACGTWTIDGDQFSDSPLYATGDAGKIVMGGTHTFSCKIVGNRWHHSGALANGLKLDEIWERVEPKAAEKK
jgi:hypothetical protein